MSDSHFARRHFLHALIGIPLLGGAIKLLGDPTGAAGESHLKTLDEFARTCARAG
jgi:hypothetical protein